MSNINLRNIQERLADIVTSSLIPNIEEYTYKKSYELVEDGSIAYLIKTIFNLEIEISNLKNELNKSNLKSEDNTLVDFNSNSQLQDQIDSNSKDIVNWVEDYSHFKEDMAKNLEELRKLVKVIYET